jgi:hypothetical protein
MKKRIDIRINEKILIRFRKKCLDENISASEKIEQLMLNDLKGGNTKNGSKKF